MFSYKRWQNKEIKDKRRELQVKSYTNILGFILGRTLCRDLCLRLITSRLGLRNGLLGLRDNVPYCKGVLRRLVLCKWLHLLGFRYEGIRSSDLSREGLLRRNRAQNLANIFRKEDILNLPEVGVRRNGRPVLGHPPGHRNIVPTYCSHLLGQPSLSICHSTIVGGCHRSLSRLPGQASRLFCL